MGPFIYLALVASLSVIYHSRRYLRSRRRERLRLLEEQTRIKVQLLPSPAPVRTGINQESVALILKGDPLLAQIALEKSGLGHLRPDDVFDRWEELLRVIQQIPEHIFQILYVAVTQTEVDIDCRRVLEKVPVPFPTGDVELGLCRDPSRLADVLVEDLALDDDVFYARLAADELRVFDYTETRAGRKVMYMLLDVSPSMQEALFGRSYMRHIWARGVAIKQLIQALRGEATYFLRYFAGVPGRLYEATTVPQAQAIINNLFDLGFTESNTNIQQALETAVEDIREREHACAQAEILLLSDGESPLDTQLLKRQFGNRIRLHTVLIGNADSDPLKELSVSYLKL